MTKNIDAASEIYLSIKNVVWIVVFLITITIGATAFVSIEVVAKNTSPAITKNEKKSLLSHLDKDLKKQLERQKIDLEVKYFTENMLHALKIINIDLKNIKKQLNTLETGHNKHITNKNIHM